LFPIHREQEQQWGVSSGYGPRCLALAILGHEKVDGYHTRETAADQRQLNSSNLILLMGLQFANLLTMINSLYQEDIQIMFCTKPFPNFKSIINPLQLFNAFGTESTESSVDHTCLDRHRSSYF
jgi:hypothetical protein